MAKAKKNGRGRVKLSYKDLSAEGNSALHNLADRYTSIEEMQEALDVLKAEVKGNAELEFTYDNYYGDTDATIRWSRDETDEEWLARLEKNKSIAAGQRKKRAADKKQKVIDEKAELARLRAAYPEEEK